MCIVLPPAVQAALTIVSGVANYASQAQAARAQEKAQYQASINEMKRWQHEVSAERIAEGQEDTADALEAQKAAREAQEAIGTIITRAEERGVEGKATGLAVANFMQANANYQTALDKQGQMRRLSRAHRIRGGALGYVQNMTRINKPIDRPNFLGTALNTAMQASAVFQNAELSQMQRGLYARERGLWNQQTARGIQSRTMARQSAGITGETFNRFRIQAVNRATGAR